MALIIVASFSVSFRVIGDNVTTILDLDVSQPPYNIPGTIKRVPDLIVEGIPGLTVGKTFTNSVVTLTFSAPFVGVAAVRMVVLT